MKLRYLLRVVSLIVAIVCFAYAFSTLYTKAGSGGINVETVHLCSINEVECPECGVTWGVAKRNTSNSIDFWGPLQEKGDYYPNGTDVVLCYYRSECQIVDTVYGGLCVQIGSGKGCVNIQDYSLVCFVVGPGVWEPSPLDRYVYEERLEQ